jgi:hypothetical protein
MRLGNTMTTMITLIIITTYSFSLFTPISLSSYAQQDLKVVKSKNLQIELNDNLTTSAQLTFPVVDKDHILVSCLLLALVLRT